MIRYTLTRLGAVRVDELILPIVSLRLISGGVEVVAQTNGPIHPCEGYLRVFTADGEPVTELVAGGDAYHLVPQVPAGSHYTLTTTMTFLSTTSPQQAMIPMPRFY